MPRLYKQYDALQGKGPLDLDSYAYFLRMIVPFNVLFYSSLWAVKISFMLFFAKLGNKLQNFKLWWWIVLVITIGAYLGCIGDIQYDCTIPHRNFAYIAQHCSTPSAITWVLNTLYANAGLDIGTDILILSIPTLILWNTGVPLKKKIILLSIFSATIVIMIVALIRVLVVNSGDMAPEIAWLYFWSSVEVGTAIIIACVASFRQLFVAARDPGSSNNNSGGSSRSPFRFFGASFGRSTKGSTKGSDGNSGKFSFANSHAKKGSVGSSAVDTERGDSHDRAMREPLEFVTVPADGYAKENSFDLRPHGPAQ
jgi:hypothetical protein